MNRFHRKMAKLESWKARQSTIDNQQSARNEFRYSNPKSNALTFDVEDWLQSTVDRTAPIRDIVVEQVEKILSILEDNGTKATFFVLGLVADKFPRLIQKIASLGHEIATHGYGHEPVSTQTPSGFAQDLEKSIKVLEDLTGTPILGYRAPYFSISRNLSWAFDILCQHGIHYDSSVFLIGNNRYRIRYKDHIHEIQTNYGTVRCASRGKKIQPKATLVEFPPSTVRLGKISLPTGGGAYFRFLPYSIIRWAMHRSVAKNPPAMVYMHSYEFLAKPIDPVLQYPNNSIRLKFLRFSQNLNRSKSELKLRNLLRDFKFAPVKEVLSFPNYELKSEE